MESCTIQLTSGAIGNNKLNVRTCGLNFFPPGIIGGHTKKEVGTQVTINAIGIEKPIITDIPSEKNTGKPRWILRERSSVGNFYRSNNLISGDTVIIRRLSSKKYELIPHLRKRKFIDSVLRESGTQPALTDEQLRQNGIVYTPPKFAEFVAKTVLAYFMRAVSESSALLSQDLKRIRILDPACGNGELLHKIWMELVQRTQELSLHLDPRQVLCGIDTDRYAVSRTRTLINCLSAEAGFKGKQHLKFRKTNALFPYSKTTSEQGWARIKKEFDAEEGFDIIIANPPWGGDVSPYNDKLSKGEFCLFRGQFDTSDLFVEKALSVVRPGGHIAFIVPDSLFGQERVRLRELLLQQTHIEFIGRFGEKIFDNINRACAVFVCRKVVAKPSAMVDCIRLTPDSRKRILAGISTFWTESKKLTHRVPQSRFVRNARHIFDIDVNVKEETVLRHFEKQEATFADYLTNNRGVELSKRGRICRCKNCNNWMPFPKSKKRKCPHCRHPLADTDQQVISIIHNTKLDGCQPLLVGESIKRYALRQTLWIATQYEGLNYKEPLIYNSPKILVRKTGVGISASIDYTNAYTNQVVYIFRHKVDNDVFAPPLEFFLGVLNSRAIYYFLTKKTGETEWRSHPYITQRQIMSLPLPKSDTLRKKSDLVQRMVSLLRPYTQHHKELPPDVDVAVEQGVAELYGLTRKHYEVVYATLESVEELLPVKALKRIQIIDIFGN
jgi:SAM-dependent methyltransferase